jgi:hypothetical protein
MGHSSDQYFKPAEVISWVTPKRAEFPDFPFFLDKSENAVISPPVAVHDPAVDDESGRGVVEQAANGAVLPQMEALGAKAFCVATKEQILEAFQCSPVIFEEGRKYSWFVEARTKGRGGKTPVAPMFNPVAFALNLPGTAYGGRKPEEYWKALKRYFPDEYDEMRSYDPNL